MTFKLCKTDTLLMILLKNSYPPSNVGYVRLAEDDAAVHALHWVAGGGGCWACEF